MCAAEEVIRIQKAAGDIGIGHRRVLTALAVADGARVGTGALRSNGKQPAAINPGDGTTACRYGGEVEGRDIEPPAGNLAFGDFERCAAFDKRDIAGRAAHIERHETFLCVFCGEVGRSLRARGRAGKQCVDGFCTRDGCLERHDAAIGLHQETLLCPHAAVVQPV